jgi:hypothetical protein
MAYFEKTKVTDENGNVITPAHEGGVLARILQMLLAPLGYDKSLQRYRQTTVIESGTVTTVTTVTTCGTVTNLSTIDTLQGRIMVYGVNNSAWADCHRSRIT